QAPHSNQAVPPARPAPPVPPAPPPAPPAPPAPQVPADAGTSSNLPRPAELIRPADLMRDTGLARPDLPRRRPGEHTTSVHLPLPPVPAQRPLPTPIYRTTAFGFGSSAEYAAVLADAAPGFSYSRIDNPTVEAFCAAVAALEGVNLAYPIAAQAFASGMAAMTTVLWTFARAGAHVVAPTAVYGGTYSFLRNVAARFGVQTEFVEMTDLGQIRAALRPGTSVVLAETLANPTTAVADLAGLAR